MTQKFLGHPLLVFYPPQRLPEKSSRNRNTLYPYTRPEAILDSHWGIFDFSDSPPLTRQRPISGSSGENLMCRDHAGSSKARSAQVLRNSPRAMQLSGYNRSARSWLAREVFSCVSIDYWRLKTQRLRPISCTSRHSCGDACKFWNQWAYQ